MFAEILQLDAAHAAIASGHLHAMLHDHCVMKHNLGDCDVALRGLIGEVSRLRAEAAHMKRVCGQATVLQERLSREVVAQEMLRKEGAQLAARNSDLVALIHEALSGDGDVECTAFLNALSAENGMLWRLFHISRSASLASTASAPSGSQTPTAYLRKQRPSLGTRTQSSSSS